MPRQFVYTTIKNMAKDQLNPKRVYKEMLEVRLLFADFERVASKK